MTSDAHFVAAQHLLHLGRYELALERIEQNFDPTDPWHWWLRAIALLELERPGEAIAAATEGLRVDPELVPLLRVLARAHLDREELPQAETAVLSALRLDAEDADLLALYALIVAKAKQLDKADKLIARARRVDPDNASALRVEAALALARGNGDVALLRSRELLALDPEDPHAHALAGSVLHSRGDIDGAAPHWRTAVVNEPSDLDYGRIARENLYLRHPLMWPLRPTLRFGFVPMWLAAVAIMYLLPDPYGSWFAYAWIAYCVYSWVVPPIVRRMIG